MGFESINRKDTAYKKAGDFICRYCKGQIKTGLMKMQGMRQRNYALRRYCSMECYLTHKKEIQDGAAERVRAYQKKIADKGGRTA